jgi:hypothetical protein
VPRKKTSTESIYKPFLQSPIFVRIGQRGDKPGSF